MYNGIGLQTARGSGTNGYVQTNKFFVRPRNGGKPVNGGKVFEDDQGTAGLSKKPNKAILEHDRKRQIHLKLAILEDKLADQGYSDAEIAQKLDEARVNLEAAAAANEETDTPGDSKISDTQTHQIAARKEKQMEAFRAALGLPDQQQAEAEEGIIEDEPTGEAYEGRLKERREHSFLDRDSGRKRDEDVAEKDGKDKESKKLRGDDDVKRHKKRDSKKRRHGDSSDESDEHGRDRRRRSKKKARERKQENDSENDSSSSESESDSDSDDGMKRRKKATKKRSRSRRSVSSGSEEVESDDNKRHRKSHKKIQPSNRSGSKEGRDKLDERSRAGRSGSKEGRDKLDERSRAGRRRHDSDDSEPESEDDKQLRKKEEAYCGGQKPKRDDEDEESSPLKGRLRGDSGGKKTARDSDDSEIEYENKKRLRSKVEAYSAGMSQKRIEEDDALNHGKDKYSSDSRSKRVASDSDDSEVEYENRRKVKDESNVGGREHIREEDKDYSNHGRDKYRSEGAVKRRGTIKEDNDFSKHKMDRYRGRGIEEEDNDKGDDHMDNRYRPKFEMADDDEYYKRSRDRYRGDKEDRFRDAAAGKRREDEDDDRVSRDKGRSHYSGRSSGKRSSYGDRD